MKIQTGNFGNALPQDQGARRVADTNAGAIAQGAAQLAQTGQQVIMQQQAKELQEFEQKKAAQERITSLNKLTAAELESDRLGGDLYRRVKLGEIDTATAQAEYSKTWSEFQKTQLADVADPEHKSLLGAQFGQYQARQYSRFNAGEREAFDAKAKGDFTGLYNNIVQLSVKDPATAKQKLADALMVAPFAQDEKARIAQRGAQEIDGAQVKYQISEAGDNVDRLKAVQESLRAEGKYTGLQPDTKESYWASIQGKIDQVGRAAQVAANQRESAAKAQMTDLEKQILSGGLIDPTRFAEAEAVVAGTSYTERYKNMTRNYVAIQDFRSRPMPEQATMLRQLSAQLTNTATKNPAELQQILGVYQSVYAEGAKQAKENPLSYISNQTGKVIPPLDMAALAQPNGLQGIAAQLSQRFQLIDAMTQRDGSVVGKSPFYPEEVDAFKQSIASMNNGQKLQSLALLARASGGGARYDATLKQLGADDPAFRLAGLAQAAGLKTTYGANVADLVLAGDKIRRENTYPLPPDAAIDRALNTYIDGAVPIGSEAHSMYVQMTRMVYAGMAARDRVQYDKNMPIDPDGVMSGDDPIMDAAVRVVTGGVTEHAGSKIIRPYAMPESNFQAALTTSLQRLSQIHGVDLADIDDMPLVPIVGAKAGMYHISDGRGGIQRSPKNGQPMIVAVQ